jgi:flagellar biosynthetic protein FlhB
MAAQDAQDRNLPASARKLRKAREDGQVARSRDLGHFATIGAGGAVLVALAPQIVALTRQMLRDGLSFDARKLEQPDAMTLHLVDAVGPMLAIVLPLGLALIAMAFVVAAIGGGWVWTAKPLQPQLSRIDPIAGLGRVFSKRQVGDALKASGLALVLGTVGALYLRSHIAEFGAILALPLPAAVAHVGGTLVGGLSLVLLALAVFAAVDVPLQRHLHRSQLKMSHQEQKQEIKEVEGNLEVKGRIKARMREIAKRRMLAAVPTADLVVMNPTHYAVALRYDEATMGAPRVVAKGADLLALRIRDLAREAQVPVLQAPPLARALYAHAEVDQEVPPALFAAVAQVLAYVYQLRAAWQGQGPQPGDVPDVQLPPGLDPQERTLAGGRA